jgi:hypothetical protein
MKVSVTSGAISSSIEKIIGRSFGGRSGGKFFSAVSNHPNKKL